LPDRKSDYAGKTTFFEFEESHTVHAQLASSATNNTQRKRLPVTEEQKQANKERLAKLKEEQRCKLEEETKRNQAKFDVKDNGRIVFSNILLGSFRVASNAKLLEKHGVVAVVNCTDKEKGYHSNESLVHLQVNVLDDGNHDIARYFEESSNFIKQHSQKGIVLVHCREGASRSPTIVLAHLVHAHSKSLSEALDILHNNYGEEFLSINDGFKRQLMEWEKKILNKSSINLIGEKREIKKKHIFDNSPLKSKKRSRSFSLDDRTTTKRQRADYTKPDSNEG